MRLTTILILTFLYIQTLGQSVSKKYRDYFGHSLEFNDDSTFRVDWRFDMIHTWASGKWISSGHIIRLRFVDVYDTLSRTGKPDSLVLSIDENSNRINEEEFAVASLVSGGQRSDGISKRLFHKGRRLFLVDKNGKLDRSKRRGIWPQKKWPWGYKKWPTCYKKET